jgi:AraC-like DNA-binding protein
LEATRSKALVQRVRDVPFLTMLAERSDAAAQKAGYVALLQAESLVREVLLLIATEAETPADGGRDEEIEALLSDIRLMPERRWSIDAMAKQACLSRSQLSRRTERVSGMSPMEYVIRTRLERACRLLIETRQSVSEIAVSLGYDDAHYFSRQFTGRFGMSPSRYRTTGM